MTRIFLITLGLWSLNLISFSQSVTLTGESPNYFLKVDEVYADGVRVTETLAGQVENFAPGDKVLIIQMTGATIDSAGSFKTTESRSKKSFQNTGRFEILQVDEVNISGPDSIIYFTDDLSNSYDNPEKIQLVKLVEGETITVNGTLTSKSWDGKVGGIIALLGIDTIRLSSNSIIDASGNGFRGALAPVEIYADGLCRYGLSGVIKDTLYFKANQLHRSGNKGEGIITTQWPYTKGTGFNLNGGGAGNGLFAGGGGGSNYLQGGDGGQQSASCSELYSVKGGWGGYSCYEFYQNPELPMVIFGGGGGSGTRKSGSTPSNGGNGGGMIILITGSIVTGTNVTLKANGTGAWPATTTGSGAGGGAGGTILIDATEFSGPQFKVEIKGGNGGSTTTPTPNVNGAGGGGSGGVFWHSGPVSPQISLDSLNGSGGITPGGSLYPMQLGLPGLQGIRLKNLIIPLTGFLFNSIRGTDTICESQLPDILTASQPKGGDGTYTYVWQQSNDNLNWSPAIGEDELRTFIPVALNQTTYYRRIVSSSNPVTFEAIHDTSRAIEVFVYPAISNNSIIGTDTICYNDDAAILTGTSTTGGNGAYNYVWQSSNDQLLWNNSGFTHDFDPPILTVSTTFRRIVNSTPYCSDTSNFVKVSVLPAITGNAFILTDTAICENTSPGRIGISYPGGGDGSYTFGWQYKTTAEWITIPSTSDSALYTEGIITETTSFRRIVYSGYNNACIDTSNNRIIDVRPPISNNFIEGPAIRFACYNSPVALTGSVPLDGFGPGTYSYAWEESSNNIDWQENTTTSKDYNSGDLTSKRFFRRKVYSTPEFHECMDLSPTVEVRINPLPTGNVNTSADTVCAGSPLYVKFNVSGSGPFNVSVRGDIEESKSLDGITGPTDSILFNPTSMQEFVMVSVEDDSGCFADINGFTPIEAGIVYEIPVADAGSDAGICGLSVQLEAIKTNQQYEGLWTSADAVFSDSTLENATSTVDYYGPHIFRWTESNWNCIDDDEVEITFYEQPPAPDAGPDQELDFSYTTQLQASTPIVGTGVWTVTSGSCNFDDITIPDAVINELNEQTVLRWTIVNGLCPSVSDSVKISVKPLKIPKAFTPNNDNNNDCFDLGALHTENTSILIFNRAGQLVYESADYCGSVQSDGSDCQLWYGRNKNNVELPEGTYFYIIRMKIAGRAKEFEFRSFVEILR